MLTRAQRNLLFWIFCAIIGIGVGLEVYLVYSMIEKGATLAKGIAAAGLIVGCGTLFMKMVQAQFLDREVLPTDRLHRFASARTTLIEDAWRNGKPLYETRRSLINNTLRFAEETLQGWVPGSHFELCVFIDSEQPLLFAYFDSKHETIARSMRNRQESPSYYLDQGYEVTKILQQPTSEPRIIADTAEQELNYAFATTQQREQIKSSLLLCIDLNMPSALVISSNEKDALAKPDKKLMAFIRFIGEQIKYDLVEGAFLQNIRDQHPEVFPKRRELIEARNKDQILEPISTEDTISGVAVASDQKKDSQ